MKIDLLNGANLAYIGDAYYELKIRTYLLNKDITNQNKLHRLATKYVSAEGHKKIMDSLIKDLSEEEVNIYKRGRNHKVLSNRKNVNLESYLVSSGFEALIGYLYLKEDFNRLDKIIKQAIKIVEEQNE